MPPIRIYQPDGNPVEIDDGSILSALQSEGGWFDLPQGSIVNLVDDNGEGFSVPFDRDSLRSIIQQRKVSFETPEQADYQSRLQAFQGSTLSQAKALLGETVAGAIPFLGARLSDPETLKMGRETNPGLSIVANIAGALGTTLATGGVSTAATAAGKIAAASTAGKIAQGAKAVLAAPSIAGDALKAAVIGSKASSLGRTALGTIAGGGLEGAIYGAAAADEQAYIDQKPLVAEDALGSMGLGSLFGMAMPAAASAIRGSASAAGKLSDALMTRLGEASESIKGLPKGTVENLRKNGILHDIENKDIIQNAHTEDFRRLYQNSIINEGKIPEIVNHEKFAIRPESIPEGAASRLEDAVSAHNIFVNSIEKSEVHHAVSKKLGISADVTTSRLQKAIKDGDPVELVKVLDDAKKDMSKISNKINAFSADPRDYSMLTQAERDYLDVYERQYMALRDVLEDKSVVGSEFAKKQKEINSAYSTYIHTAKEPFFKHITKKVPAKDGYSYEVIPDSVRSTLFGRNSLDAARDIELLGRKSSARIHLFESILNNAESENAKSALRSFIQNERSIVSKLDEVGRFNANMDMYDSVTKPFMRTNAATIGMGVGLATGSAMTGIGTSAVVSALQDPMRFWQYRDFVSDVAKRFGSKMDKAIGTSADAFLSGAKFRVPAEKTAAYAGLDGSKSSVDDAKYIDIADKLSQFSGNPERTKEQLQMAMPNVFAADQMLGDSMAGRFQAALDLVTELMSVPSSDIATTIQMAQEKISERKKREAAEVLSVINDPLSFTKMLGSGTLTRASVEAFSRVYPMRYQQIVDSVMERAAGKKLTQAQKVQISILMRTPISRSYSKTYMDTLQSTYSQEPKKASIPKPDIGKTRSDKSLMTQSDRIEYK